MRKIEHFHAIGRICRVLNDWAARPADFLPESGGEVPGASVWALSADPVKRRYIDGGTVCTLPFVIRRSVSGASPAEKVDALGFFAQCTAYLCSHTALLSTDGFQCDGIRQVTTPAKTAVFADGTVEYAAQYVMEYRTKQTE